MKERSLDEMIKAAKGLHNNCYKKNLQYKTKSLQNNHYKANLEDDIYCKMNANPGISANDIIKLYHETYKNDIQRIFHINKGIIEHFPGLYKDTHIEFLIDFGNVYFNIDTNAAYREKTVLGCLYKTSSNCIVGDQKNYSNTFNYNNENLIGDLEQVILIRDAILCIISLYSSSFPYNQYNVRLHSKEEYISTLKKSCFVDKLLNTDLYEKIYEYITNKKDNQIQNIYGSYLKKSLTTKDIEDIKNNFSPLFDMLKEARNNYIKKNTLKNKHIQNIQPEIQVIQEEDIQPQIELPQQDQDNNESEVNIEAEIQVIQEEDIQPQIELPQQSQFRLPNQIINNAEDDDELDFRMSAQRRRRNFLDDNDSESNISVSTQNSSLQNIVQNQPLVRSNNKIEVRNSVEQTTAKEIAFDLLRDHAKCKNRNIDRFLKKFFNKREYPESLKNEATNLFKQAKALAQKRKISQINKEPELVQKHTLPINNQRLNSKQLSDISYIITIYIQYKGDTNKVNAWLSKSFEEDKVKKIITALKETFKDRKITSCNADTFHVLGELFFSNLKIASVETVSSKKKEQKFIDKVSERQNRGANRNI